MFSRPLSDRIHRPLGIAVLWSWLVLAVGSLLVALIGSVGWAGSFVASWFAEVSPGFPWDLAEGVAAVVAPFLLATSCYAASYASAERNMVVRGFVGTLVGLVALVVLVQADRPIAVFGALAVGWSLAAPFEHWARAILRLLFPTVVVAIGLWIDPGSWLQLVAIVAASPPAAAIGVWLGDLVWIGVRRSVVNERSEHHKGEREEARHQDDTF